MASVYDVSDILSKIKDELRSADVIINDKIDQAVKIYFQNENGSLNQEKLEKFHKLLKEIYVYLPLFTSADPPKLLEGLAGIVSSVSSFTGWGGPASPVIFWVLSKVFSSFGGKNITIGEVVKGEIRRIFSMHSEETLLEEAADLHLMYRLTFDFLKPTDERRQFSEHDITNMNIQMNVFQGATFLRKLGKLIKNLAKEHEEYCPKKKREKANKAIRFIELYTKLALLRDMVLLYFFTITSSTTHSQHLAGGIQRVISAFDEQDREVLGMFLKPTEEYVYIVAFVREGECELLMKFLEQKRLLPDHSWLGHGDFQLYSVKWPEYHVTTPTISRIPPFFRNQRYADPEGRHLCGTKEADGPKSLFRFTQIYRNRNYVYIVPNERSDEFSTCTGINHSRGEIPIMLVKDPESLQNEWKAIQMENGNFVFSSRAFPGFFMGMTSGCWICGLSTNFREQVQWKLRAS